MPGYDNCPTGYTESTAWINWNTSSTTASTTIWANWCNAGTTTTASATSTDTWVYWVGTGNANNAYIRESEKRIKQRQQAEERWRKEEEKRKAEIAAAEARAELLLLCSLRPEQVEEYKKNKHFTVVGRRARYRVRYGRVANVDVIDEKGYVKHRLCAHPIETVPNHDTMLAQRLLLENHEDDFIKIANIHPSNTPERVMSPLH